MKFWISLKKQLLSSFLLLWVEKVKSLLISCRNSYQHLKIIFWLEEFLSAFENDIWAWDEACSCRGRLIWVVQRNQDWIVQEFVGAPHVPPHPWSVGAVFGGEFRLRLPWSPSGEGGCVSWVRSSESDTRTPQCLQSLWVTPPACFVCCCYSATYLIHFVFSERKSSICGFHLTVLGGWEQNILTPLCSLYGVTVARLN